MNTREYNSSNFLPLKRASKLPHYAFTDFKQVEKESLPFETTLDFVHFPQTWHNSNKLLACPGFDGVKTGITNTAGACLAVHYRSAATGRNLISVVLGSRNIEYRWKDTHRLTLWAESLLKERQDAKNPVVQ